MGNVEGVFVMRKVTSKYFRRKYVKKIEAMHCLRYIHQKFQLVDYIIWKYY